MPEVRFDFCFMGDESKGKEGNKVGETMSVLVDEIDEGRCFAIGVAERVRANQIGIEIVMILSPT